jgi:DNA polymerase III alpha subunit
MNKKSLDSLAKAGGFDQWGYREQLVQAVPQMVERCKQQQMQNGGLFG